MQLLANQCAESVTGWVEPQRVGEEGGRAREGERTYKIKVNTERRERGERGSVLVSLLKTFCNKFDMQRI